MFFIFFRFEFKYSISISKLQIRTFVSKMKNALNSVIPALMISLISVISSSSCNKNDDRVPNVAVDEYINLNLPEYQPLRTPNNWVYYNYAGNKGIIIYCTATDQFTAVERTCTFDPSVSAAIVQGIPNEIFGVDSVCGSKFNLMDGNIVNGPANQPLLKYRTRLLQNDILHIYN